jgi:glutamate synthase (NADPH/NADH) large chain
MSSPTRQADPSQRASARGLYDPAFERDSCGFGLIAQLDDHPSPGLVQRAIEALVRMSHRGAVDADGLSGDGCGLLIRRPANLVRALADEAGIPLQPLHAMGLVFLPCDPAAAQRCRDALAAALARQELGLAGWREVPVDASACGERARALRPGIEQVFVNGPAWMSGEAFERALFLARRQSERELAGERAFYVASLSAESVAYKAMVMPKQLARFFPDLAHPALASACVVFHQRFSTNTRPDWPLAQPFRMLAHNGEINSIRGNRLWAQARGATLRSPLLDFRELQPLVSLEGSDSQSLDNMLEVLLRGGMDLLLALRVLIPPAWQAVDITDADLRAFYEYFSLHMEPWDGPAGIVVHAGRHAACTLDRNGLRPARWMLTRERVLVVASEAGVFDAAPSEIVRKGRLGPGEMIAVDFDRGELLESADIDAVNRARAPFKRWLKQGVTLLDSDLIDPALAAEPMSLGELQSFQKLFGVTREERDEVLRVLAETQQEAIGSMGDDTPLPVLSRRVRSLYDSFRQAFAQVTNPPIDPIRERLVMSLHTQIARESNLFELRPEYARQIELNSPVLSQRKLRQILTLVEGTVTRLELNVDPAEGLAAALDRLCAEAEAGVAAGSPLVLLSDRQARPNRIPVHALLATGAVHLHLVRKGLRTQCNLLVETGTARDPHHFACLIGYGATAVYPYLAYQCLYAMLSHGEIGDGEARRELGRNYRRGIRKGLLKILSKMGISSIASYRGAQLFEIVGLADEVVARCFEGTPSRIGGMDFAAIEADQKALAARAWDPGQPVEHAGLYRWVQDGEYHMYNPDVIASLQRAVRSGDPADYAVYAEHVNGRPPAALRDLLALRLAPSPLPIEAVEPLEAILPRFDSAGMSLGALSPEAHEALAVGMNRLGGRSNSGEGGEDPARYGTEKMSKIKQVASGRFGVTPAYLVNAEVLQIKIAQGAKPGEGGQLPGHKVNPLIARLRHAKPGIGLISPPPHHDIYSIEDLAQLIFDLKAVNPSALVSVKLVAHAGVGTIAAGVVKAGADLITVSGHDGGTGASPLTSIKYAGVPWELGLAEAHQTLVRQGLRQRVILQTDGGLKTGLDVVKAALLGADSFGFGTAPMVALGCKYLRICHLNNCATGVATQHDTLRKLHFVGLPEMVERFFRFVAEETRQWLARLGVARMAELIGRAELLERLPAPEGRGRGLDLSRLLDGTAMAGPDLRCDVARPEVGELTQRLLEETRAAIAGRLGGSFAHAIRNTDRAVGTHLSGEIARRHGDHGMADRPITVRLSGSAGQSFGAFNAGGLHLYLTGEANDYVGKGMAGGRIVVRPPADAAWNTRAAPILGNTCLYGATGGELFAAGRAGERFAVRNSGATAVIEGAGDHCCEYMTGGVVVVLGRTGINFGAGFTGGFAYVLDIEREFVDRFNHELIDIHRIIPEQMENHLQHLRGLIQRHVEETGSAWGADILDDFRGFLGRFWLVKPKAASLESLVQELRRAA